MNLHYDLPEPLLSVANLPDGEEIKYCAPYDLDLDGAKYEGIKIVREADRYAAVTGRRIIIFNGRQIVHNIPLSDCGKVRCEPQVGGGIMIAAVDGTERILCRFSMRHLSRFAYISRGANILAGGENRLVESTENEKICSRCGRALPGTSICPRCDGRAVTLKKFWKLCSPYKFRLLAISLFMIAASAISLIGPAVQKTFIDDVLKPMAGGYKEIAAFILIMLVLTVLSIVLTVAKNWFCTSLGARISMDLREKLYHKLQLLSLSYMNMRKPGDLMNRIVQDTGQIRRFMEDAFGNMLSTLITMVGALVLMLAVNWKLTIASVIFLPVVAVLNRLFRKHTRRLFRNQRQKSDKINSSLQDVISGMRVVKSFGKEKAESEKFNRLNSDFADIQKRNEVFFAKFYPILTFIMGIGIYVVTYLGGVDVLADGMTVGGLTQFIAYAGILYGPLGWMTRLPMMVIRMTTGLDRIYDILDEEPDIVDTKSAKDVAIKGDVSFKNVTFGYKSYEPVLDDVSFTVKQGEMIGLVGPSGAGKSTLINLIMRLYNIDDGKILIDGVNIEDISVKSLHNQLGVVLQETFLFSGTVLNNIRFSKPGASLEEVIKAAKMANAHNFICKMPDGYNTYVGEKGHNLSGGERQRVAIARAILGNPRLLILDEATSSLDTESEYQIQKALDRLTEGRTTFAIAHRLSTLRNADRLMVIDRHRVVESGTHNELLEKKGIYYSLVTAQLQMHNIEGDKNSQG